MITGFHTLTLAAADLDCAARAYETVLASRVRQEADVVRVALSNVTLEVRACAGSEPQGLRGMSFATAELTAARRRLERRGAPSRLEGGSVVIDPLASGGLSIALQEPEAPPYLGPVFRPWALDHVVIHTTDMDRAAAFWGARLGLDLRLDRSSSQFGSRLLFFRCGSAVVEVVARLGKAREPGSDVFGGMALRVSNVDFTRRRLLEAGVEVSEARSGRKPGTRVFTIRSGLPAGPTLIIGPEPVEEGISTP